MATKSVSSVTHNSVAVAGCTRFTCSLTRTATPVVCGDGEVFASGITTGGWECSASIDCTDPMNAYALEGDAPASLVAVCPASDNGGTAKTFTITLAVPNGFSDNVPEPGSPATSSINFNCSSTNGTAAAVSIA